jgi:quinol monooxygenase YgiN
MTGKTLWLICAAVLTLFASSAVMAEPSKNHVVRIAELEIDPAQLQAYKALLAEEIEASVRIEPGVLSLSAVSIKGNPTHIRILEVYADQQAYEAHLKTSHFLKYKTGTAGMVRSLNLLEAEPVMMCAKAGQPRGAGC